MPSFKKVTKPLTLKEQIEKLTANVEFYKKLADDRAQTIFELRELLDEKRLPRESDVENFEKSVLDATKKILDTMRA